MKRIVIPVAAVAVLAIGGAWWLVLRNASREAPAAQAGSPAAKTNGSSQTAPTDASRPGLESAARRPNAVSLRDQIRDAPDLRAYYESVKDAPDPTGERSYRLAEAIFQCTMFVDQPVEQLSKRLSIVPPKPDQVAKRDALLVRLSDRCKGFNGMGNGLLEITGELHRRAEAQGYPAEIARSLRFEPAVKDLAQADATAKQLLAKPDPEVLLQVAQYLDARNGTNWLRQFNMDIQTWNYGWGLMLCDLGADCGPRSGPVMMVCILRGACDVQRVEEVVLIQGGQSVVNGADNLRNTLPRRIANQDWAGLGFIDRSK